MKTSLQPDNDHLASARHEFNMHPDHKPYDWDRPKVVFDDNTLQRIYDDEWNKPIAHAERAFMRGAVAGAIIEAALIVIGITLFYWLF